MPDAFHISLFDGQYPMSTLDGDLLGQYVRHLSYNTARVADVRPIEGTPCWRGSCPFCEGDFHIEALTGWATCLDCGHQSDPYALEFILFGEHAPERWEACRRQAELVMAGPLTEALPAEPAPVR